MKAPSPDRTVAVALDALVLGGVVSVVAGAHVLWGTGVALLVGGAVSVVLGVAGSLARGKGRT